MDKKNTFLGLGLLGIAFLISFWQGRQEANVVQAQQEIKVETTALVSEINKDASTTTSLFKAAPTAEVVARTEPTYDAETFVLENDKIAVTFTSLGGAIQSVALKDYPAIQNVPAPFAFNADGKDAILGLSIKNGNELHPLGTQYTLVAKNDAEGRILFRHLTAEGIEILRGYQITDSQSKADPYLIVHETKVINHTAQALHLNTVYVHLGTVPPVEGDKTGEFLNFGYYNGKDAEFISVHEFQNSSGFFGIGKHSAVPFVTAETSPIQWAAIKNQFFTAVLTPEVPASSYFVNSPTMANLSSAGSEESIAAAIGFNFPAIEASTSHTFNAECYVGPKEYDRLQSLGNHQDLIMQFGLFGFISKLLLVMMTAIHNIVPNYGLTIIFVTLLIKLVLWPLTAASFRSSRRMAALQEPLQSLRAKFKDNPQRLQQETMKLFKEYRVNPAAGCLPILVQIPIFLGLFWMLRSASELRFAHFLWIQDLSLPDTVLSLYGMPLNILPLIMGVTMVLQMKFSPTPTSDPIQKKLFQLMPFLFLVICYNFPAGLVLYWTVQNCFTILQQWWMRRDPLPSLVIEPKGSKNGKRAKKFA